MEFDPLSGDDEMGFQPKQSPTPHYSSTSHPYESYSTTPLSPTSWTQAKEDQAYRALRKRRKNIIAVTASVLLVLILSCGVAFGMYIDHVNKSLTQGNKTQEQVQAIQEELKEHVDFTEPFYMLLLGSDAREGETVSRTDTNIVAYVDTSQGLVTLISIPRDTRIEIEGHGHQKFNAAYAFGDTAGTIKAANELLGIEIAHYAEVDFFELTDLVDAVGGVDITVDSRINDRNADLDGAEHTIIEEGEQHLNGTEALVYARSRSFADGDFTRTSHQRELISALITQILSLPMTDLPGVIEKAAECVTTDLSLTRLLDLANQFKDVDDLTIYSAMVPSYTTMISGVSYVINDEEATGRMMALVEKGKDPSVVAPTSNAVAIENPGGSSSSGSNGTSSSGYTYTPPSSGTSTPSGTTAPETPAESENPGNENTGGNENVGGNTNTGSDPSGGESGGDPSGGESGGTTTVPDPPATTPDPGPSGGGDGSNGGDSLSGELSLSDSTVE